MPWPSLRRRPPEPPPGPLADLAGSPLVDPDSPVEQVDLLATDLETTGLDPARHELLCVGFVPVRAGEVLLGGTRVLPVRPRHGVGESAVVHGLTDDQLDQAPSLREVLPQVLSALAGDPVGPSPGAGHRRVLLAHFAHVETTFLAAACRAVYGTSVDLQVVDTLALEQRLLRTPMQEMPPGRLRLDACRRAHGLPRYRAHSAGIDAIACAELFLAQCGELADRLGRPVLLRDVQSGRRLR